MCGITGFFEHHLRDPRLKIENMVRRLAHRGPNDSGHWIDESAGLAFGHTRLSILDLSPLGHQPMHSRSQRFVMTFNGEIYNYRELSSELSDRGHTFRGGSDTEVMLAAFEEWGVEGAVRRFGGMFAFAVWDAYDRRLYLVRDRTGKKPLYYGWSNGTFFFASELKSLRAHPDFQAPVDRDALALMLRMGYVPGPYSIYKGIFKLPGGRILPLSAGDLAGRPGTSGEPAGQPVIYWSMDEAVRKGRADPFCGTEESATDELQRILREAVRSRMIADVPLGAFLSGGIDSSLVVALMQEQSSVPVKTFTIGFHEQGFNEAEHAKRVASTLGTEHTELYLSGKDALQVVPQLPQLFDEPFGDSSSIPTYLVAKLAGQQVTVALSGDGGDEFFAGYPRYHQTLQVDRLLRSTPRALRHTLARLILGIGPQRWEQLAKGLRRVAPSVFSIKDIAGKSDRLARVLCYENLQEVYQRLVTFHGDQIQPVPGARDAFSTVMRTDSDPSLALSAIESFMLLDSKTYLPDDILVKVDRASMGVSLEARAPLLDHHVIEFSWRLPLEYRYHRGTGKVILRKLLNRYLSPELFERPKMGFGIPYHDWLRTDLREWGENLLDSGRIQREGYLDAHLIRDLWATHQQGINTHGGLLWNVLMFQAWIEDR